MSILAYNIRIIRGMTKLTQTDFGKEFGVTLAMQKSYESGKAAPDDLYIQKISEFTKVPEADLKKKKLSAKNIPIQVEYEENGASGEMNESEESYGASLPDSVNRLTKLLEKQSDLKGEIKGLKKEVSEGLDDLKGKVAAIQSTVNQNFEMLIRLVVEEDSKGESLTYKGKDKPPGKGN